MRRSKINSLVPSLSLPGPLPCQNCVCRPPKSPQSRSFLQYYQARKQTVAHDCTGSYKEQAVTPPIFLQITKPVTRSIPHVYYLSVCCQWSYWHQCKYATSLMLALTIFRYAICVLSGAVFQYATRILNDNYISVCYKCSCSHYLSVCSQCFLRTTFQHVTNVLPALAGLHMLQMFMLTLGIVQYTNNALTSTCYLSVGYQ